MQSGKGLEALAALLSNQLTEVRRQRMQPCAKSNSHDHRVPNRQGSGLWADVALRTTCTDQKFLTR